MTKTKDFIMRSLNEMTVIKYKKKMMFDSQQNFKPQNPNCPHKTQRASTKV